MLIRNLPVFRRLCLACLLVFKLLFPLHALTQDCIPCGEKYKIARYDFAMKIPAPDLENLQGNEWLTYNTLFSLGRNASKFSGVNPCLSYYLPPVYWNYETTNEGIELAPLTGEQQPMKIGLTYTLLPPANGPIEEWEEYIITGSVTGGIHQQSVLEMQIQTACSREIVASASTSFMPSYSSEEMINVAHEVNEKLKPLSYYINKYEEEKRINDPSLTLFSQQFDVNIGVIPQKKNLKTGESTKVFLELKDCDGHILAGREIRFNDFEFAGNQISGTRGGVITPATVITDAQGKATVTFTLKPGAHEALIYAHSPGFSVKGCPSILVGDAAINIEYQYSGNVSYTMESVQNCQKSTSDKCTKSEWESKYEETATYKSSFYVERMKMGTLHFDYSTNPDADSKQPADPYIMETGEYTRKLKDRTYWAWTCEAAGNNEPRIKISTSESIGKLDYGGIRLTPDFFSVSLFVKTEEQSSFKMTYLPSSHDQQKGEFNISADFNKGDPNTSFEFTKEKSGTRTKYTVLIVRTNDQECSTMTEKVKMTLWEE